MPDVASPDAPAPPPDPAVPSPSVRCGNYQFRSLKRDLPSTPPVPAPPDVYAAMQEIDAILKWLPPEDRAKVRAWFADAKGDLPPRPPPTAQS